MRGFFGKIPTHGDFVDRGLAAGFKSRWDEWLQHALAASKAIVGQDWLDVYLTSPVWRFVLGEGVCGSRGWTGVIVPSVDRVGRYFPLTIAAATPSGVLPLQVITAAGAWFEAVEALALRSLEDESIDADALTAMIEQLGDPLGTPLLVAEPGERGEGAGGALAMPLTYGTSPGQGVLALCHRMLETRFGPGYSAWWTSGSDLVHPGLVTCAGLPAPESYAGLLTDRCAPPGWQRLPGYRVDDSHAAALARAPEALAPTSSFSRDADVGHEDPSASVGQSVEEEAVTAPAGEAWRAGVVPPDTNPVSSDDILADLGPPGDADDDR